MITEEDFVLYLQAAVWFVGNKIQWHPKISLATPAQQLRESQQNIMAVAVLWSPAPPLSSMKYPSWLKGNKNGVLWGQKIKCSVYIQNKHHKVKLFSFWAVNENIGYDLFLLILLSFSWKVSI